MNHNLQVLPFRCEDPRGHDQGGDAFSGLVIEIDRHGLWRVSMASCEPLEPACGRRSLTGRHALEVAQAPMPQPRVGRDLGVVYPCDLFVTLPHLPGHRPASSLPAAWEVALLTVSLASLHLFAFFQGLCSLQYSRTPPLEGSVLVEGDSFFTIT